MLEDGKAQAIRKSRLSVTTCRMQVAQYLLVLLFAVSAFHLIPSTSGDGIRHHHLRSQVERPPKNHHRSRKYEGEDLKRPDRKGHRGFQHLHSDHEENQRKMLHYGHHPSRVNNDGSLGHNKHHRKADKKRRDKAHGHVHVHNGEGGYHMKSRGGNDNLGRAVPLRPRYRGRRKPVKGRKISHHREIEQSREPSAEIEDINREPKIHRHRKNKVGRDRDKGKRKKHHRQKAVTTSPDNNEMLPPLNEEETIASQPEEPSPPSHEEEATTPEPQEPTLPPPTLAEIANCEIVGEVGIKDSCTEYGLCEKLEDIHTGWTWNISVFSCPAGMQFDHISRICKRQGEATCLSSDVCPTDDISYPGQPQEEPAVYVKCVGGVPWPRRCDKGTTWDNNAKKCVKHL